MEIVAGVCRITAASPQSIVAFTCATTRTVANGAFAITVTAVARTNRAVVPLPRPRLFILLLLVCKAVITQQQRLQQSELEK